MFQLLAILSLGTLLCGVMDRCSRRRVLARFSGRRELLLEDLRSECFGDLPDPARVKAALSLLETNLGLPVGLLRPGDRLRDLDYGVMDGQVDNLYEATAQFLGRVDLETLGKELEGVSTVGDFVALVARFESLEAGEAGAGSSDARPRAHSGRGGA